MDRDRVARQETAREIGPVSRGKIPVIVDGGICRGLDWIYSNLLPQALTCALLGGSPYGVLRWDLLYYPHIYLLLIVNQIQYNGEAGVDRAIKVLLQGFRQTMMSMKYVILCPVSVLVSLL